LIETFSGVDPKKGEARAGLVEKSPIPREINEFSFQGILQPTTAITRAERAIALVGCAKLILYYVYGVLDTYGQLIAQNS